MLNCTLCSPCLACRQTLPLMPLLPALHASWQTGHSGGHHRRASGKKVPLYIGCMAWSECGHAGWLRAGVQGAQRIRQKGTGCGHGGAAPARSLTGTAPGPLRYSSLPLLHLPSLYKSPLTACALLLPSLRSSSWAGVSGQRQGASQSCRSGAAAVVDGSTFMASARLAR